MYIHRFSDERSIKNVDYFVEFACWSFHVSSLIANLSQSLIIIRLKYQFSLPDDRTSLYNCWENLVVHQPNIPCLMIIFILNTSLLDNMLTLKGEIIYWSLESGATSGQYPKVHDCPFSRHVYLAGYWYCCKKIRQYC